MVKWSNGSNRLTTKNIAQERMNTGTESETARPPLPPFTKETAIQKIRLAEDAWNTRDPVRVAGDRHPERPVLGAEARAHRKRRRGERAFLEEIAQIRAGAPINASGAEGSVLEHIAYAARS